MKKISAGMVAGLALYAAGGHGAFAAEYVTNADHGGADWTLAQGDIVAGTHTKVGVFTLPVNCTVSVQANTAPHYGFFRVEAETITLAGTLNANAAGAATAGGTVQLIADTTVTITGAVGASGASSATTIGGNGGTIFVQGSSLDVGNSLYANGGEAGDGSNNGGIGGTITLVSNGSVIVSGGIGASGGAGSRPTPGYFGDGGDGGNGGTITIRGALGTVNSSLTANGGNAGYANGGGKVAGPAGIGGTILVQVIDVTVNNPLTAIGGKGDRGWNSSTPCNGGGGGAVSIRGRNVTANSSLVVTGGVGESQGTGGGAGGANTIMYESSYAQGAGFSENHAGGYGVTGNGAAGTYSNTHGEAGVCMTPSLTSPADGLIRGYPTLTFEWGAVADYTAPVNYYAEIDNDPDFSSPEYASTWISGTSWALTTLTEDVWYWRAKAKDGSGNQGTWSASRSFTVGLSAPGAPVNLTATPAFWTNGNNFSAAWTNPAHLFTIAGAYYKIGSIPTSATDGTYVAGNGVTSLAGLSVGEEGVVPIYVWLKDELGRASLDAMASVDLYYDSIDPSAPVVEDVRYSMSGGIKQICGTAEAYATIKVYDNGNYLGDSPPVDENGNWCYAPAPPLTAGDHTISAVAEDQASNPSPRSYDYSLTPNVTINAYRETDPRFTRSGEASLRLEREASREFKFAVNAGAQVTASAYLQKNDSYGPHPAPSITMTGAGIDGTGAATAAMTGGAGTWEQLTVSATPGSRGVVTLTVETFSAASEAKVWVDDLRVSQ